MLRSLSITFALLVPALLGLVPVNGHAFSLGKPGKEQLVDQVLTLSGTKQGIGAVADNVSDAFNQAIEASEGTKRLSPKQRELLGYMLKSLRIAFDEQQMLQTVSREVLATCTEDQLKRAIELYKTALAKKMVRLEVRAAHGVQPRTLNAFANELQIRRPSAARMAIIEHIARITGNTRFAADLTSNIVDAFLHDQPELRARLIQAIDSRMKDYMVLIMLYTYRDVPDNDLQAYARLYTDESFAWVVKVLSKGAAKATLAVFDQVRDDMADWAGQLAQSRR